MVIYLVYGEHSDDNWNDWWIVKAFKDKDEAIAFEHDLNNQKAGADAKMREVNKWYFDERAKIKVWNMDAIDALRAEVKRKEEEITIDDPYFQLYMNEYKIMETELA